jgi:hypothetical protein
MKNFIEPINGTKIAEFKLSWFKQFIYGWVHESLYFIGQIIFRIGLLIFLPIKYGIAFMNDPFNPLWLSWTIGIILFLIGGALAFLQIKLILDSTHDRKTKQLTGKLFSLFAVKEGIEINSEFIPYKVKNTYGFSDGVDSFKIEGDFLIVKTNVEDPFILISRTLNENEIKFKIDSKYLNFKEELLSYLNNQIGTSEAKIEEKKKKKKKKGIDIFSDDD